MCIAVAYILSPLSHILNMQLDFYTENKWIITNLEIKFQNYSRSGQLIHTRNLQIHIQFIWCCTYVYMCICIILNIVSHTVL